MGYSPLATQWYLMGKVHMLMDLQLFLVSEELRVEQEANLDKEIIEGSSTKRLF